MSINNPLNPLKKTSETSPGEVYSTEETRIGTWIDGKPLYRKVVKTASPISVSANSQAILRLDTDIRVVKYDAYIDSETLFNKLAAIDGSTNKASYIWFQNYNVVVMYIAQQNYTNKPVFLIIEYTKTTDEPEATT